jgi:chromosome segregation ATPase
MNNELIKLQEFNVKSHVKTALKESKKTIESKDIDAIRDNKETLLSLVTNIPDSESFFEEKSKLNSQLELIENTIVSLIKEKSNELQKTSDSLKETSTKHSVVLQEKVNLEKKLTEATKVVAKLKEYIEKEEKEFQNSLGVAKNDVVLLEKEVKKRDSSIKLYETSYNTMKHDIGVFVSREKDFLSRLKKYSASLYKIKESLKKVSNRDNQKVQELLSYLEQSKKLVKEYKNKFNESATELVDIKKKYLESIKEKNQIKESVKNVKNSAMSLKKKVSVLEAENKTLKVTVKRLKENHPDFAKKRGYEDYAGKPEEGFLAPEPSQDFQYEVDKNKNYLNLAKENKKFIVTDSVKKLYESKVKQYPAIKSIQNQILKSRSVSEAVELIEYFLSNSTINQPSSIKESVHKEFGNSSYYPAGSFLEGRD